MDGVNEGCRSKMTEMNETGCPICGNSKYEVLFHGHNRGDNIGCSGTYVQCRECSLVYLHERPPWEKIVRFYSSLDHDITADSGQVDVIRLRRRLGKRVPKWKETLRRVRFRPHSWPLESASLEGKRLLDLGCGNGAKLVEFAQRGYDVWGVDVGKDSIRVCRAILPQGHFIQGELQGTGLPVAFFDHIRIDNALEHVPNPGEVVEECYRLLRQGGKLFVFVPHGKSLSIRIMKGNSISAWIPFHLHLFTYKSLRRLIEDAGFKQIKIYGYNPISWLPLSIMQRRNEGSPNPKLRPPTWFNLVCFPIGWLATKLGMGEELVGISVKK